MALAKKIETIRRTYLNGHEGLRDGGKAKIDAAFLLANQSKFTGPMLIDWSQGSINMIRLEEKVVSD